MSGTAQGAALDRVFRGGTLGADRVGPIRFMPTSSRFLFRFLAVALLPFAAVQPLRAQNDPASRRAAIEAIYPLMIQALETKNYGRARNICEQAIAWEPQHPLHHYNLACIEAQVGGTRLPIALGELQLAVALGFDDAAHLQNDPDLAPLHRDPKFAAIIRNVAHNASAAAAQPAIVIPPAPSKATAPTIAAADSSGVFEQPAPAAFQDGVPVGLYLMSRYFPLTRTAELLAWYFAPDGRVYQNLRHGFSANDLAAHAGPRGQARANGHQLEVRWSDGRESKAGLERDGTGFIWDRGIFTAIGPFENPAAVAGIYEGDEPATGELRTLPTRLELRADGSFVWTGVTLSTSGSTQADANRNSRGRWELRGCSLILTAENTPPLRRLALPSDDEKTPIKPDRMFFGGAMYRHLP